MIDIFLYANDKARKELGHLSKADHLRAAISELYTSEQFNLNPWSNRIIDLWCDAPVGVVWGCSGSGKSTTLGLILLLDLLADPHNTYTCLVTSPQKEHPNRTWGNVVRYYSLLPDELKVGAIKKAPLGLHTAEDDKRAGIHCYSTEPGESVEDFKKRVGAHQKRNRFAVDEAQKCSESILSAMSNLGSIGAYQEMYIFNPASWFTADGKVSTPRDMTIQQMEQEEPDEWTLKRSFRKVHGKGICLDGVRSPALTDESLEGILIDRNHRDTISQNSGEDSFEWWSQFRGRMPPEGAVTTFITRGDLEKNGCMERPDLKEFTDDYTDFIGLDPSDGKDDATLVNIRVGTLKSGVPHVAITRSRPIHLKLKAGDISGQIATETIDTLNDWGVPIKQLAVDSTAGGAQTDRIERDYGTQGAIRVMWQGPPSKDRISPSGQTAADTYNDKATELFAAVASLARLGRISGITPEIAHQLTTRRKLIQNGRAKVEPKEGKDGWRNRNEGRSPNELDSLIAAIHGAIKKHKIRPYAPVSQPKSTRFSPHPQNGPPRGLRSRVRRASQIASRK